MRKAIKTTLPFIIIAIIAIMFFKHFILIKSIYYGYPDAKDAKRSSHKIIKSSESKFLFEKANGSTDYGQILTYDDWKLENALKKTLRELAQDHKSNAFILIKNDTILYEEYFNNYTNSTSISSYSIAKSILSLLVGIALEEKKLRNLDDLVITYIPELKKIKGFEDVKLLHLINHTTGIKAKRIIDAYLYYGETFEETYKYIEFQHKPGLYQEYQNINAQILGLVLSRAVKESLADYFEEKIWSKIGTEENASWRIFAKNGLEKSFCCISASAIDYAKLGRLVLNDGKWGNEQVVPNWWIKNIMTRDSSGGSSRSYNKSWYLGLERYQDVMAIGLYKQFIYISKTDSIIIIRFGDREKKIFEEKARWPRVFRQTIDQLN